MELVVNNKKYDIKFGYIATIKSGIISEMINSQSKIESMDSVEAVMELISKLLLVGLQKFHRDEFGYNYDTKVGYDEAITKAYDLIETYLEDDGDFSELSNNLQEELVNNSFLAKMFNQTKSTKKK